MACHFERYTDIPALSWLKNDLLVGTLACSHVHHSLELMISLEKSTGKGKGKGKGKGYLT